MTDAGREPLRVECANGFGVESHPWSRDLRSCGDAERVYRRVRADAGAESVGTERKSRRAERFVSRARERRWFLDGR
jgi:hypothetical protein